MSHNCLSFRYAEIQDKSSDINISMPTNVSNVNAIETNQNNKENQVENNLAAVAVGLDDGDTSDEEEELEAEEEQAIQDPHIEIVISDDEELS